MRNCLLNWSLGVSKLSQAARRRTGFAAVATALAVAFGCANGRAAEGLSASESKGRPTEWTLSYGGRPVLTYAFDPQQYKPYIKALYTPNGVGVLRDAPGDHLHHHGLMYGIKVNGINFWEETAGCGVEKVVEWRAPETGGNKAGLPQARIVQTLFWLAPEDAFLPNSNAPALLIEQRTLTLVVNPARRETAVEWKSHFRVGSKTNTVTLTGANYHGLGMRFLEELDPVAEHFTETGKPDLSGRKQDVSAHEWEAVYFELPGKAATIALFSSPNNARGRARFFAMKTPFAYLSATQGLDTEPLVYRAGEEFELCYLVTLYPERKTPAELAERNRQWNASLYQP
jgi:hypothetical protein